MDRILRRFLILLLLTGVYFLSAWLGLRMAFIQTNASAIWPPTGIALASMLIFGPWIFPAILVGAFAANIYVNTPWIASFGIAIGNTLEAVLGALLVEQFAGGRHAHDRPAWILKFVVVAAFLSTTVSATIGVTSLCIRGAAPWLNYVPIWGTWWLGDAVSNLIVAPLILIWA